MHALMMRLARFMAVLGGVVLTALIILVCLSVIGRGLNGFLHGGFAESVFPEIAKWLLDLGVGPLNGDFELVEAGVAFSIFAFIPWCQITSGHATVDIFTSKFPMRVQRFLAGVTEIVFAAVLVLIAWRLMDGMQSKMRYGETTFLLQFPVWWAYAASLFGATAAAVVGVYMAIVRTMESLTGRQIVPAHSGDVE